MYMCACVPACLRVQISDFGVSLLFEGDDDRVKDTEGSAAFMAPEMCSAIFTGTDSPFC